jgi:arginine utilization protein RocB
MYLDSFEEVKRLTKEMVAIPSINKAPCGETAVSKYVYDYYMNLDYFKSRPNQVKMFMTKDDSPERHSTYAYVKGTKGSSDRTVILIGHVDTVGVDDFGTIKDYAFDAEALPEKFMQMKVSQAVIDDIKSGQYMFGRGALDMKSGVAGHMFIMKYFAQHPEELDGNVLAIAECDEEDMSKGIISALDEIVDLKQREGFQYVACINADYSTNYNPGDENRYVYFGCIGKTLPTFVAFGKEAHVGQSFAALDPNLLIAEITRRMSLNTDLCDIAHGEVTVPPISLKQADTKVGYTVQTALVAMGYYNFFTHGMNPSQVLEKSRKVAVDAFDGIVEYLNVQYRKFCEMSKVSYTALPWKTRVYTWKEFYDYLTETRGSEFVEHMDRFARELHVSDPGMDLRQYGFTMCQEAWNWAEDKSPAIIVFFGSLYSANIEMTGKTEKEKALMAAVEAAIAKVRPEADRQIKTRMFYPYIADSSFMAVGGDPSTVDDLNDNMPSSKYKYKHNIEQIMQIDVPVVNIGTFGRDGHMVTERVDMKQTFENVPNMAYETIKTLLG